MFVAVTLEIVTVLDELEGAPELELGLLPGVALGVEPELALPVGAFELAFELPAPTLPTSDLPPVPPQAASAAIMTLVNEKNENLRGLR